MSGLNFLNKLLDGVDVEWLSLGELGDFIRGNGLQKKDFVESGFPAIHYGQIYTRYGLSADKTFTYVLPELANKLRKAQKNDLLLATTSENDEDVVKPLAWLGDNVAISGDMMLFRHEQNVKYLAYFFQSEIFQTQKMKYITGAKVRRVSSGDLSKIKIPIPSSNNPEKSLTIQSEIVRILDKFTALTTELTAELTMRKNQYNYYRDQLLSFKEGNVAWKTLGEISRKISSGGTPKTGVTEYYDGTIPWLRTQEVDFREIWDTEIKITEEGLKTSSAKWIPKDCIIIAMYGATVGKIGINKIPMTTNQACANIQLDEEIVHYRYVFHFLCSQYAYIKSLGTGSQTNINAQIVKNIKIPVPFAENPEKSLNEQLRIVNILDKFDTLTSSITEGLPREIELRQKQYEYYRDLLFSFPKHETTSN
ncbi:restriction endonuclease subunit S [Enterobacter hormaechei]|uniref:restriction endonuclease subunit S n=1 Tax=Enterobacter hormaechei TaxID=158836 RepID=UPI00294A1436|nr:restriction endonuclease subunit S [Enterobacter hormaechei]MDV5437223.1 restriction endonuclease subunit S [Enterobacter hormaechei]